MSDISELVLPTKVIMNKNLKLLLTVNNPCSLSPSLINWAKIIIVHFHIHFLIGALGFIAKKHNM